MLPLETKVTTIPAINFVNIAGRNVYTYTTNDELKELERIAGEQFGWDQNTIPGRIYAMKYVVRAAYYN